MAELRPVRALRYAADAGDLGELLAPPFDVIGPEEAAGLRARHPHNAVRLVLPESGRSGEGDAGPGGGRADGRYRRAERTLREWRERGVLVRDAEPGVYLYRQRFRDGTGGEGTRSALLAALRLVPLDAGRVVPHEETHRGPKEDRLALTEATGAQLSPVFLVARDRAGRLHEVVSEALEEPAAEVSSGRTPDGITHQLGRLPPDGPGGEILAAAGSGPLLIADGHHRYETALAFSRRPSAPDGARWVLACVVSDRDPGLRILPTHRALGRPPSGRGWEETLDEGFVRTPLSSRTASSGTPIPAAEAAGAAAREGGAFMSVLAGGTRGWGIHPRSSALEESGLEGPEARLAPFVLDRLLLRERYGMGPEEAAEEGILTYHRDVAEAVGAAGGEGAAFLLPPLCMDAIWEVCTGGRRLPPKSTYFWPKIPSGLAFRLLAE